MNLTEAQLVNGQRTGNMRTTAANGTYVKYMLAGCIIFAMSFELPFLCHIPRGVSLSWLEVKSLKLLLVHSRRLWMNLN